MKIVFLLIFCCLIMNCSKCSNTLPSFQKLLHHLRLVHSNEHNFSISCNFKSCHKIFRNVTTYKAHAYRKHYEGLQCIKSKLDEKLAIQCFNCNVNLSFKESSAHLKQHFNNNERVKCPVNNCKKEFTVYSSYTSHLTRKHKKTSIEETIEVQLQSDDDLPNNQNVSMESSSLENGEMDQYNLKRNVALLQLKIQEKYLIPQSTVQKIFEDYTEMFKLTNTFLLSQIGKMAGDKNVDEQTLNLVKENLTENHIFKCFEDLNSICKRKLYYKCELNCIEPITYNLGSDMSKKKCVFHYVPILETLKFLLIQETVLSEVLNPSSNQTKNNLYVDFKDGDIFKKHPLFSKNPYALQLFLYCDEFEVCNPLGVNRKVHKLVAFYYVLGNINPKFRSTVDCIQLALLCSNVNIKKFGLQEVVKPLIKDLKILSSDGIFVNNMVFHGDLAYIAADNLASHFIGGFLESFSPNVNKPCRTCLCSHEELTNSFDDDKLLLRTRDNYNTQAGLAKDDPKKITEFGIKCTSPFNVGDFHVVEGLPPDIAHDLLEGIVPYETSLVLQHLITVDKLFTLSYLNSQIESFPYGTLDSLDKPCIISNNFKVTQTASKMWCLIRLLPLMCHTKVAENNLHWALLLDLKSIVEIVFAPQLNIDYVAYLKMKIIDHLKLFKELFPNKSVKPKHHFLIHYARHVMNFGPLKKCWTLRFEAKHYYFKRLASAGKNFKQLGFTLAQRHQMYQTYIAGANTYLQPNILFGSRRCMFSDGMNSEVFSVLEKHGFVENAAVNVFSFVSVNSLKYTCGMYIITGFQNDDITIGCIDFILSKFGTAHLLIRHTECFYQAHVGAYTVNKLNKWSVLKIQELYDVYPLTAYYSHNQYYVVPKYVILESV